MDLYDCRLLLIDWKFSKFGIIFFFLNTEIAVSSCLSMFYSSSCSKELFFSRFERCSWQLARSFLNCSLFWMNSRFTLSSSLISSLTSIISRFSSEVRFYIFAKLAYKYPRQCLFLKTYRSQVWASSFCVLFLSDSFHFGAEALRSFILGSWFTRAYHCISFPSDRFYLLSSTNRRWFRCSHFHRILAYPSRIDFLLKVRWCRIWPQLFFCLFRCFDFHNLWFFTEYASGQKLPLHTENWAFGFNSKAFNSTPWSTYFTSSIFISRHFYYLEFV